MAKNGCLRLNSMADFEALKNRHPLKSLFPNMSKSDCLRLNSMADLEALKNRGKLTKPRPRHEPGKMNGKDKE